MRTTVKRAAAVCALAALPSLAAWPGPAGDLKVVVTSKPAHALVAGVMDGIAVPMVLIAGPASPHSYAMKPSDAQAVNGASVFFRISEGLEPFTGKLLRSLPKSVRVVSLGEAPGIQHLAKRTGATFDRLGGRGHDLGHGHGHAAAKAGAERDPHVWLDPQNAKAMVTEIARVLAEVAPVHANMLRSNALALNQRLDALDARLAAELKPLAGKPFIVMHDAVQYFEQRYGLAATGSISISPDLQPSAKRLTELRKKVQALGAVCVFSEPNFESKVVNAVIEGTSARTGVLDPEGTALAPSALAYESLMTGLARGLAACLGGTS